MSSSLSGEMTTTRKTMKRIERLFHVGRRGKLPHSSAKSILMVEGASSFLGTNNIDRFTNMLYCITLIETRKDKSLNIIHLSERNDQSQRRHRRKKERSLPHKEVVPRQSNDSLHQRCQRNKTVPCISMKRLLDQGRIEKSTILHTLSIVQL